MRYLIYYRMQEKGKECEKDCLEIYADSPEEAVEMMLQGFEDFYVKYGDERDVFECDIHNQDDINNTVLEIREKNGPLFLKVWRIEVEEDEDENEEDLYYSTKNQQLIF